MLGTNDLKHRFSVPAADIAASVGTLVDIIQRSATGAGGGPPQLLLIAPPPVGKLSGYAEMFGDASGKSGKFAEYYQGIAAEYGCWFLNSGEVIVSSDIDGIHFEADQHTRLGRAVAQQVKSIFES
jgi:lysophospholipase L1-like esterase